jgi:PIN domain nuclease of toxin-antitoxin system
MPGVVADTHAALWYLTAPELLSRPADRALTDAGATAGIFVSAISIIEIVYLVEKGRLPREVLERLWAALEEAGAELVILPVDAQVARLLSDVPRQQVPDMPDRVIAATALAAGLPLVTRDGRLRACEVETIW